MRLRRGTAVAISLALSTSLLAGCGGGSDTEEAAGGTHIVVGAMGTPESEALAHIYGGALERAGADVDYRLGLAGPGAVLAALVDGTIDLAPLVESQVVARPGLTVAAPAEAEAGDVLVITKALSNDKGILQVSDLTRIGGFDLDAAVTDKARLDGTAPVVGRFAASDPDLAPSGRFLVLEDDEDLLPSGHVVPVVRTAKATPGVIATLDHTSEELTLDDLQTINEDIADGSTTPAAAAEEFLLAE